MAKLGVQHVHLDRPGRGPSKAEFCFEACCATPENETYMSWQPGFHRKRCRRKRQRRNVE